jgi:hypothetical protein
MNRISNSKNFVPRVENATSNEQLAPVPIGPGTFYNPVSQLDSFIVNTNPVARHLLSASTASKDAMAAAQLAARGDFAGAAAASMGFWQAMVGVVAPF